MFQGPGRRIVSAPRWMIDAGNLKLETGNWKLVLRFMKTFTPLAEGHGFSRG